MKKYKIVTSKYPEGNKTHIIECHSWSLQGESYTRCFKGSKVECEKYLEKLKRTRKGDSNENNIKCRKCGHTITFRSNKENIICNFCGCLNFKDKKAEFNYKVKRKYGA